MLCEAELNTSLQMFPSLVIVIWTTCQEGINTQSQVKTLCGVLELSESKESSEVPASPLPNVNNASSVRRVDGPMYEERAGLVKRSKHACCFGLGGTQPLFVYFLSTSFLLCDVSCYILLQGVVPLPSNVPTVSPQTAAKLGYLFIWLLKCNCFPLKPQRGKSFALAPGQ